MAPHLLATTSQEDNQICPSCQKLFSQVQTTALPFKGLLMDFQTKQDFMDMANVVYINDEIECSSIALKDSHISSASWKKLFDFLQHTEQASQSSGAAVNSSSPVLNHELPFATTDLSFLLQKQKCVDNIYTTPDKAQVKDEEAVYQNDVTGEISRLVKIFQTVEACLWYFGDIGNKQASKILQNQPVGTFLLRNSSDPRYLFALSVVTAFGPTSIRIVYSKGKFNFDSEKNGKKRKQNNGFIPSLSSPSSQNIQQCVIHMVLHYTEYLKSDETKMTSKDTLSSSSLPSFNSSISKESFNTDHRAASDDSQKAFFCSLLGPDGLQKFPLVLSKPYLRRTPSLCEHTRFLINKQIKLWKNPQNVDTLPLSNGFSNLLTLYPYPV